MSDRTSKRLPLSLFLAEEGANRARLQQISNDLCETIDLLPGVTPEVGRSAATPGAKGPGELLPAVISAAVSTAALLPRLTHLLKVWLERDGHRRITLKNEKTGEEIQLEGVSPDDALDLLVAWFRAIDDEADG